MQGSHKVDVVGLKSEPVWFKIKLVSQFLTLSFLLTQPFYHSYLHAAPIGGEVVGGTGTISQNDLTTTINQTTQNLAIDWQSFDVNTNERVQFIQPGTTSIALNRILGNNGSIIQGKIDSNGQVILVNPNGIFFTSTATINVGGLVASSLNMTPSDFMNGNYVFNEVIGTDGAVINSGIINASVGGNVALIGKQVKNDGLISANLGSVILAAGKQSILTFDNQGLIGVQVTKEVLQDEIGLEEAVINSGDITAAGGRVLLTASTSKDVFSQAVNSGVLDQATSVVVNDDGTFTLGAGADILNSGSIDVSSEVNADNTARIVLIGENITSSGQISADVIDGQAGEIELHAKDEMLLTENSITSAQALSSGQGGLIKVLGDKVGLFDYSKVNASGANGGGEVLIGGDQQGLNSLIRNANFIYLGENTSVNADAILNGDGGKIITFAKDTARINANLFARGGLNGGNGGFIETSGLRGFEISKAPDVSAVNGDGGLWLIDPYNIEIVNAGTTSNITETPAGKPDTFTSSGDSAVIDVSLIEAALFDGDVSIVTGSPISPATTLQLGDITFNADLVFSIKNNASTNKLTLQANNDITFTNTSSITMADGLNDSLNLKLVADGDISISSETTDTTSTPVLLNGINLEGGNLDITSGGTVTFNSGKIDTAGGNVNILSSNAIDFNGATILTGGGDFDITNNATDVTSTSTSSITTTNGDFTVSASVDFDSSNVSINVGGGDINFDGSSTVGVTGDVILGGLTGNIATSSDLTITKATSITQATGTTISIARNTDLNVTSGGGSHSITLNEDTNNFKNIKLQGTNVSIVDINGIDITGGTDVSNILNISTTGNITDAGAFSAGTAIFDTTIAATNSYGNITLNENNDFTNVKIINANDVYIKDVTAGVALEANDGADSGGIRGSLTVNSTGAGNITDMNNIAVSGTTYTGEINVGGASSFTVASGQSIYLDTVNNTFGSNVTFLGLDYGSPEIDNITIVDDDTTGLTLSDVAVTDDLTVTAGAIIFQHTHADNLVATTNIAGATGDISQTAHLDIANSTTLNAAGTIGLSTTTNDFNELTILNGQTVTIYDDNTLNLLSSNTSGNLTIDTDGLLTLSGNISTNSLINSDAGSVLFQGSTNNVELASNVVIDTTHNQDNGASYNDGSVTFTDKLDNDDSVTQYNLELLRGKGNVIFENNIGETRAINKFIVSGSSTNPGTTVSLKDVTTSGAVSTDNINITGNIIQLGGDLATNSGTNDGGGILLTGAVQLVDNVLLDTASTGSDGAVTIAGTINSFSVSKKLTVESDTGTVDLQNNIGSTSALSALDINSTLTGGIVNLSAVTTNGGADVINIKGSTVNINGDLTSNADAKGGDIILNGNLQLNQSAIITSDATGNGGGDGDVTITGTVNATANPLQSLIINADNNNISVGGSIGGLVALQKVELLTDGSSGTQIDVGAITTADSLNGIDDSGVVLTAETVNLMGNITANTVNDVGSESGSVTVNGAAVLVANVSVDTYLAGTTTGGNVTFSSTIDADDAANDRGFSINAGNAIATITGIVGATDAVNSFSVTSASTTNINEINTQTGGIDITSGIINLYGNLNTKALDDAGQISLVGAVNLNSNTTFDTEGNTSDADIFIDGSVNNTTPQALILNAGTADVTMTGTAGAGTALASLNVIGENVDIGQVTALGDIDITGNTRLDLFGNLTSNSGLIDLQNGAVTIYDDVVLSVTGSNTVTVDGTINADLAANDYSFTVNTGSGDVTLNDDVGLIQAVQGLAISTTGTASIQNVNTRSDGLVITSNTLNLSGSIDTTNNVTTAGEVRLTQANLNLLANININTNSATGIDGNISIFDPLPPTGMLGNDNSFDLDAGAGIVNITANLTDLSSFSVANSLTTTLNDVETNNGTITVNADGDITLSGTYDSGTADMIFNADVDSNGSGVLSLNNTSIFSGNNITFSGYTFNTSAISLSAVDTVTFNSTFGNIALGDSYIYAQSILSNAFLDKITASTLQVSSDNSYVMLSGADLSDNSYSLDLDARYIYAYAVDSQLNDLNATATNSIYLYKNITASNDISLNAPVIYSYNNNPSTEITSTFGNIDIAGDISGFAAFNLNAVAGSVSILGNTTVSLSNGLLLNANVVNHDNIVATNNINIISGGAYTQTGSLESTNGNISIVANSGNVDLDYNKTNLGTISVESVSGSINDNNGGAVNIETSGEIILTATGGIGHNDPLEIITNGTSANLIAINNGSGNIEITNTGNITLTDITNNADNSAFIYTGLGGDVTITKVTLDKTFNNTINSTNAIADFNMINGDVLGDPNSIKHIEANTATFDMNGTGSIGDEYNNEPLIVEISYKLTDINSLSTYIKYFENRAPFIYEGANEFKNKALQAIENLSGQQLIDVEALADIDEAIFTDVRNYSSSDIALMMPSDQRYTEDEEGEEEEKLKRKKYMNTVH